MGERSAPVLEVPRDDGAEDEVVGVAVATHRGWLSVSGRVAPADLYLPRHRAVLAVCPALALLRPSWDSEERRAAAAARLAGVPAAWVGGLVAGRVGYVASEAHLARVAETAGARAAMAALADAYNRIGDGWPRTDALSLLAGTLCGAT